LASTFTVTTSDGERAVQLNIDASKVFIYGAALVSVNLKWEWKQTRKVFDANIFGAQNTGGAIKIEGNVTVTASAKLLAIGVQGSSAKG
jgi:hypothetical protein